jgi:antitoxin YefM
MTTVPLGEAKDRLSALVDSAESTHDIITITRHGRAAAVLMSADDLESMQETIFWLSRPGTAAAITEAESQAGDTAAMTGDDLRAEFGLPPR